ncbi:MAG: hypothetical protein HY787_17020 [Deltaproteobacteria bacterium]|nr:hypothetical protein [Deltaproteobacteria bacterium]
MDEPIPSAPLKYTFLALLTFYLITVTILVVIIIGLNVPTDEFAKRHQMDGRAKSSCRPLFRRKYKRLYLITGVRFSEPERSDSGKEVTTMCYNCGCEMPDDEMGNPKAITNKTFEEAAKGAGQTPEEAKKNTLNLLKKVLKEK